MSGRFRQTFRIVSSGAGAGARGLRPPHHATNVPLSFEIKIFTKKISRRPTPPFFATLGAGAAGKAPRGGALALHEKVQGKGAIRMPP